MWLMGFDLCSERLLWQPGPGMGRRGNPRVQDQGGGCDRNPGW